MTDRSGGDAGQRPEDWSTGQYPQYQPYGQQPVQQYDQYGQPVPAAPSYGQDQYGGYQGQYQQQQPYQAYQQHGQAPQQYEPYEPYESYGQQPAQQYDQYGQPVQAYQQGGYGYQEPQPYSYDGYQQQAYPAAEPQQAGGAAPTAPAAEPAAPAPAAAPVPPRPRTPKAAPTAPAKPAQPSEMVGGSRTLKGAKEPKDSYTTGEFTFVDEEAEETEDVIDWLKFAESRSEVRAERRRRLRNRLIGLGVVVALAAGGVGGYLFFTGDKQTAAKAAGKRQVNVVHLRDLQGKVSSALLVDDTAGGKGTVLLLPDTLRLPGPGDPAVAPVSQALDPSMGAAATRDGLSTVLGAPVAGTWRLDTPYLELLVNQLGGVRVDTNAEIHDGGKPDGALLGAAGKNTLLNGKAAVAYATLQAPGENRDAQLARFGQVMDAVVRTMPTDFNEAKDDVHRMNAVLDPSLPEDALAGVLAQLAQQAKDGHFGTTTLTVKPDGSLDEATAGKQVKDVLGGTVKSAVAGDAPARVSIQDASGNDQAAASAQVQVVNAGLTFIPGGAKAAAQATSEIRYTDDARQGAAKSLAASLGLPDTAVKKVGDAQNADLVVVLGKDYQPSKSQ
ncbi:LytR C-terminal domain-containing protein [Streptomyces sp. SP17BM10]|uniref:LCP family protein n=1 Tax=Streptomyces sp. SP17BM10 TaxID=3002530 RepID=UPI002E78756A|nr:LytR C-terminal domain-containing protein [Streptomyces sp. SP17BM10]MEE1787959.1 LytR C-terminal domain-containing protein [Streptomyces sp. SP17BM10]